MRISVFRRRALRGFAAAFCLLALAAVAPGDAAAKVVLTFGTYAPDKPSSMVTQLRPTLNAIAEQASAILGEEVEIKLQLVKGYDAGIALIVDGQADFTRLGPASYIFAKDQNDGLTVLAMESKNGAKSFDGVIAVHRDSPLTDVSQLRGHSFAFGSKRSTLGRYFSQLTLMQAGVYARDLSRYEYLGRHDKVGRAVGSGLFDAGSLEETTFKKLVDKGVPIRALARYSNSTRPWVARAGLDPRIREALQLALLKVDDREALRALRFDGFFKGDDSDYNPTRDAIRRNPQFFAQLQ